MIVWQQFIYMKSQPTWWSDLQNQLRCLTSIACPVFVCDCSGSSGWVHSSAPPLPRRITSTCWGPAPPSWDHLLPSAARSKASRRTRTTGGMNRRYIRGRPPLLHCTRECLHASLVASSHALYMHALWSVCVCISTAFARFFFQASVIVLFYVFIRVRQLAGKMKKKR